MVNDLEAQRATQHGVHPTGGSLRVFKQFLWLEVVSVKVALSRPTHHPTGGSLRVFKQFLWLEVVSVKVALSRPTHQRVTLTVGQHKQSI